jgi:hypothetical protein
MISKCISFFADKIFNFFDFIGMSFPVFTTVSKVFASIFMFIYLAELIGCFVLMGIGTISGAGLFGMFGILKSLH